MRAATPAQRWERAVAARPLEAPRELPAPLLPLARRLTKRAHPPRYTTGAATRHALAAAGALGATTGDTVHLAAAPSARPADLGVLAHELAHARRPVRRTRFLLARSTAGDDDERSALRIGSATGVSAAGIVDQLPVASASGSAADVAARTARATILELAAAPAGGGSPVPLLPSAAGPAAGAASVAGTRATPTATEEAASGAASEPPAAAAPQPGSGHATGDGGASQLDPDRVIELVEERLLRELERRGGRWAGVF